ncbi:hypothetical protein C6568_07415 [Melaminivora suipulveris]|uniref:Cysteine-rich CWC family protein n=1 Tax=Melaminivora suipulveris TaxID=2109913 RepID=A0A2R3QBE1_9BURK|nr:cysteine-rich CWC family protein [Melaminivora suipulveris]AVO49105.1 hypothetical protein C6568_07415 [Melaminivora suipulveris]
MPAPDTATCPLCRQANTCAVVAGLPAAGCWCMSAEVSRAALQRVPAPSRGLACLCARCAQGDAAGSAPLAGTAPASASPS